MLLVLSGAFGSMIGSFLNVVVYRVPLGKSLLFPASACPQCGHDIRWYDNVPVLSWLMLRGRCRDCAVRIPVRYPLVEFGTALAFVPVTLRFLPAHDASVPTVIAAVLALAGFLVLAGSGIALALIDLETRRLPNVIVVPTLAVVAALLTASSLVAGDPAALLRAAIGGAGLFAGYLVLALVSRGGMGMGDVKLAALLGLATAWVGWPAFVVGAFAAFVLGGLSAVALLAARRVRRGAAIPFGPFMIAGAFVGILAGDRIVSAYLSLTGLA